jgi:uncharacterized protein
MQFKTVLKQLILTAYCKLQQLIRGLLIGLLTIYRYLISPWLGNRCRFYPSCSAYAQQAILEMGILRGLALSLWRLLRCHPWHPGGYDPVNRKGIS